MLDGAKKERMPSIPEKSPRDLVVLSQRRRTIRAILSWLKDVDRGQAVDIAAYAKKYHLSKRTLLRTLHADPTIQDEILGPMMAEARLGVQQAVGMAGHVLGDSSEDRMVQLRWAEFLARLHGGGYDKRPTTNVTIANLIPQLPIHFQKAEAKIIDVTPEPKNLEDLL
jgi:hypothetical protein